MLPVLSTSSLSTLSHVSSISTPLWQQILRRNFRDWEILANFLELSSIQKEFILMQSRFPLNLPLRLAEKITKRTLDDPILKQFLPTQKEIIITPHFVQDPVGDHQCRQSSKLLHKYNGRVLLVCSSACAMHCRYCFRQNFDYEVSVKGFEHELSLIANDSSIQEVILSGGDPLSLSNRSLRNLLLNLSNISHVQRIRFHTRFPIGIPERIDTEFLQIIEQSRFQFWFVLHINHPAELDNEILIKIKALQQLRVIVLNQAVLLREVNDDAATLIALCEKLANNGILPYYLHQLDRVQGASHFEVSAEKGRALIKEITSKLSGYAVPKYVQEIAGHSSKTSLL